VCFGTEQELGRSSVAAPDRALHAAGFQADDFAGAGSRVNDMAVDLGVSLFSAP
jgi:hypothetical protein